MINMDTLFFIKNVIRYKKYDENIYFYFTGFNIKTNKTKLEAFKDYVVTNLFCKEELTAQLIDIFCEVQKIYFAFNRLIYLYKFKKAKKMVENHLDLHLQPLSILPEEAKMKILHMGMIYTFSLKDLALIWKESLIHSNDLFPKPQILKNPYTNLKFKEHHIYNIYFALFFNRYRIPFLIDGFFKMNFNIELFVIKYYSILIEFSIQNHLQRCDIDELFEDIQAMCEKLNDLYGSKFRVNTITDETHKREIVECMKDYLLLYYRYSYSRNVSLKKRCMRLLKKEIKVFFTLNPLYGRRIIFVHRNNRILQPNKPFVTLSSDTKQFLHLMKFV